MSRPTISREIRLAVMALILCTTLPAYAADSCQLVFDAMNKVVTTPSHSYTTHTRASSSGKPQLSETVFVNGKVFIQANGKWITGHVTPQEILDQQKENRAQSKIACQFVRNDMVGAEAAAVYSMHIDNNGEKEDAQIWISKSTGLPLRDEREVEAASRREKEHRSTRFEYQNIRAPM